jgi:hypothetical protein
MEVMGLGGDLDCPEAGGWIGTEITSCSPGMQQTFPDGKLWAGGFSFGFSAGVLLLGVFLKLGMIPFGRI